MPEGPKLTLYHSELCGMGPVSVTCVAEPKASTKNKGTFYIELTVHGHKRYYNPENEGCKEFWRGRAGQTFTVVAEGRDGTATITDVGVSGSTIAPPQPPAQPASSTAPKQFHKPTPGQSQSAKPPEDGLLFGKKFVARNASICKVALKAMMQVTTEFETEFQTPLPPALLPGLFGALLYGASGAGAVNGMPLDLDFKTLLPRKH